MAYKDALIAELKMEAASTRKILERVPMEKSDWKPHDNSMKLGSLAVHVAEIIGWVSGTMDAEELDFGKGYNPEKPSNTGELIAMLDKKLEAAIASLERSNDEDFDKMWTLRNGDHIIFTLPKKVVLRSFAFSHHYHHRGQLSVYLRLLDVPIPGMYGPSYDDNMAMKAAAN